MTDIFLDEVDFIRDRWGRPLIKKDGQEKAVAYTRISGFGSILENQFGLTKWKQRTALIGAINRPDLISMASAAGNDDRKLDAIVEDLLEAGGASNAANTGTAIHEILAKMDQGHLAFDDVPALFKVHAKAWNDALVAHDLEVVPELVEMHLVNDEFEAAGSADNFLRRKSDGKLVAVDKKTGKAISPRPIAYMVQLYLYATGKIYDVRTGERASIGDVDDSVAYIAHIPANGDTCVLYETDLAAARELTILAAKVRGAEKATPKVAPLKKLERRKSPKKDPTTQDRSLWVKSRLADLVAGYPNAAAKVAASWPENVPGFKSGHTHDDAQLEAIVRILDRIEGEHDIPFGASDPTKNVDEMSIEDLRAEIDALSSNQKNWIASRVKEAEEAGSSVSLRASRSKRRYDVATLMVSLSEFDKEESVIRLVLETSVRKIRKGETLGQFFGSMSSPEAMKAKTLVGDINDGKVILGWSNESTPFIAN